MRWWCLVRLQMTKHLLLVGGILPLPFLTFLALLLLRFLMFLLLLGDKVCPVVADTSDPVSGYRYWGCRACNGRQLVRMNGIAGWRSEWGVSVIGGWP
jgi:hypothetical protein